MTSRKNADNERCCYWLPPSIRGYSIDAGLPISARENHISMSCTNSVRIDGIVMKRIRLKRNPLRNYTDVVASSPFSRVTVGIKGAEAPFFFVGLRLRCVWRVLSDSLSHRLRCLRSPFLNCTDERGRERNISAVLAARCHTASIHLSLFYFFFLLHRKHISNRNNKSN